MPLTPTFPDPAAADAGLSSLARSVVGSEILKIAAQIRAMQAAGAEVCNLTVGDFNPAHFPIPDALLEGTRKALAEGQTNYPPSDGVLPLREAVVRFYERELGLRYPVASVLVVGGARPLLYGAYRTLVDPGDTVVYPVPSWNNNHYANLSGARAVELPVVAEHNFFPGLDQLAPHLPEARLLCLNSPLNPTGTMIDAGQLRAITEAVVEENRRRAKAGSRPLYFVYDQVYWTLTFGTKHENPVSLVPESAPHVLLLDALSKAFCATGLRVGWGLMDPAIRARMADILGHVGAWAPKAEQLATAALLDDPEAVAAFRATFLPGVKARLDALHGGFMALKAEGLPVDAIAPQGAIYLSARFDLFGRTVRGTEVRTNEDIRQLLLQHAGLAVVPFQAFGLKEESGWFRLSVGAVSLAEIEAMMPRLRDLLA